MVSRPLGVAQSWVSPKPVPDGDTQSLEATNGSLKIAKAIHDEEFKVLVADSNWKHIYRAKDMGLKTYHGNVLSEFALEEIDLDGIGRMLSLTPNDEVNSLAALRFGDIFGRSHVFQLPPNIRGETENKDVESLSGNASI
ncbi:MAG: NAD-binding protein [Fodinibius sp.]|nr:NAD-binding protein [Fodinibius sp.]